MKRFLHILLVIMLAITLVLGGTAVSFGAAAPASGGINVIYDGNYITFKDAVPKIVDGRTMVPFRQILEDMGTVVTYDGPTKTVTAAKEDLTFSFVIGGTDITINDGSSTFVRKMDVVPFIDSKTNRTYVPARFMAETLGYTVGWDNVEKTVIINDFAKLFANADEDFSILNYMVSTGIDLEKTYHSTGTFDVSYLVSMGEAPMEFGIEGDMDAIQYKTDSDMTMGLSIDISDTISSMTPDEQEAMEPMLAMLQDMDFKIKMDGSEGIMYMNSNLFALTNPNVKENTWIKMDIFKLYDDIGMDIRSLMKMSEEKTSIGEMINAYAASIPLTDAESYEDAKMSYAFLKNLVGDEAFKKNIAGSSATYTLNIDSKAVAAAIAKTALSEGVAMGLEDVGELITMFDEANLDFDLVIKTKNDVLASYEMSGGAAYEGGSFDLDLSGTAYDTDMTMSMVMQDALQMTMSMTVNMEETSRKVDLTLPAGAEIIDYESMMY